MLNFNVYTFKNEINTKQDSRTVDSLYLHTRITKYKVAKIGNAEMAFTSIIFCL